MLVGITMPEFLKDKDAIKDSDSNNALSRRGDGGDEDNDANIGRNQLQDSEFTVDSSDNEQVASRWLGGMGADFLQCLTENVSPMVSGMATLVHNTAVAVANEISQLEREVELEAEYAANIVNQSIGNNSSFDSNDSVQQENLCLPWEVIQESRESSTVQERNGNRPVRLVDSKLKEQILALSENDATFLEPFTKNSEGDSVSFVMNQPRIKLIRRLLEIDENLASAHRRLNGGDAVDSTNSLFWKNYFFHCTQHRTDAMSRPNELNSTQNLFSKFTLASKSNRAENHIVGTKEDGKGIVDDESSLIAVESDAEREHDDETSFVIPSPPHTGNSFATTTSIDGSIVLVDTPGRFKKK